MVETDNWLWKEFNLPKQTTASRWGCVSVFATVFSALIAFSIGLFAVWLTLFFERGKVMDICLWMVIILAGLMALVGILGIITIAIIGLYWLKHPYESTMDKLATGFARGVIGDVSQEDIPQIAENAGLVIGKKVKRMVVDKNEKD